MEGVMTKESASYIWRLSCGRDNFVFGFFVDVLVVLLQRYLNFSCILSHQEKKKKTMKGENFKIYYVEKLVIFLFGEWN